MRRIFLTGGTGFLGSCLAYQLVQKGFYVTLLVREYKNMTGEEKFLGVIRKLIKDPDIALLKKNVSYAVGNLGSSTLGIKDPKGDWDVMLHCAASTDFSEDKADIIRATNVDGTQHALRFAKKHNIPSFHYVSTAYACGDVKGRVKEKFYTTTKFRGLYEETKNQAEKSCFSFCAENNIRLTVHRPSIIVGDSKTFRTINFEGPYLFIKQFHQLCRIIRRKQHLPAKQEIELGLKLPVYGEDEQNLVPVDYVSNFIAEVVAREPLEGKIYNITNPNPPTFEDLRVTISKLLHFSGFEYVGDQEIDVKTKHQALFLVNMKAYWPYLKPRIVFDKKNAAQVEELTGLHCPELDEKALENLFAYAMKTNFGKKIRASEAKKTSTAR